jgi:hypothetical protein
MVHDLVLVSLLTVAGAAGQVTRQQGKSIFRAGDYPSGKFKVTQKDFTHGTVNIRVIQVKNLGYTMEPDICRAWLEVRKGNQLLKRFYNATLTPSVVALGCSCRSNNPPQTSLSLSKKATTTGAFADGRQGWEHP